MKTSSKGIFLIKSFESLQTEAYRCPAGVLTIGYGHTGKDVHEGQVITAEKAEQLLTDDLRTFENYVNGLGLNLKQGQFDALVSFAYNCGIGNLKSSTLLKKVIANPNDSSIQYEFAKWNKAGGKVLLGLTRRRKQESNLYFS